MSRSEEALRLTKEVKEKALSTGADLVGIISTESIDAIPRHWIGWVVQAYTKKSKDYMDDSKSVVVLGYQAWDDVNEIVTLRGDTWEYPAYQRMRLYARRVFRFLQGLGYKAIIYPQLPQKRMAQLAGLGNFGKNSLIINPKYGPWIRLQSILTDVELVPDKPFEEDLCKDCDECIKACPVGALTPYKIDPDKCLLGTLEKGEGIRLMTENIIPDSLRDFPNIQSILDEHMPRLTKNSIFMCMTCQKACPYGREERGLI